LADGKTAGLQVVTKAAGVHEAAIFTPTPRPNPVNIL
jgi:hypothetical protein